MALVESFRFGTSVVGLRLYKFRAQCFAVRVRGLGFKVEGLKVGA